MKAHPNLLSMPILLTVYLYPNHTTDIPMATVKVQEYMYMSMYTYPITCIAAIYKGM